MGSGVAIQIIPALAPREIQMFTEWAQAELDELDFLGLLVHFEKISKAISNQGASK